MLVPGFNLCLCTAFGHHTSLFGLYEAVRHSHDNALERPHIGYGQHQFLATSTQQLLLEVSQGKRDYSYMLCSGARVMQQLNELAGYYPRFWNPGQVLRVKFLGGDSYVQERVIQYAGLWEQHANIKFNFIEQGDAEIRIAFRSAEGSWSTLGTDALTVKDPHPTMNFGWFDRNTSEEEFRATTLHEFGHCLGCIHEHQSPEASLRWNKPLIYQWMYQSYGWEKEQVDHNLFAMFDQEVVKSSPYDPSSIMHYYYPPEFTLDATILTKNTNLSGQDIQLIRQLYPLNNVAPLLHG